MNVIGALNSPWAIMPQSLEEITEIYSTHLRGETDIETVEARLGNPLARESQGYAVENGTAVISIEGVIAKKMNLLTRVSGGVSTQLVLRDFNDAMADESVETIILHVDSPGGSVDGTDELAEAIFASRGSKKIVALADGLMASAAIWIGATADQVFITGPTTMVGSIGVVAQHVDYSQRQKKLGVTVTDVYAGRYKRIATENAPLSDEGRAHIQAEVDTLYSIFVDRIAKYRGTTTADALERMADGKMFIGQKAIDAGLVDGVATLEELVTGSTTARFDDTAGAIDPLRERWNNNAQLRSRFLGDYDVYEAYVRSGGQ